MNADIAKHHVRAFNAEPERAAASNELNDINDSIARWARRGKSKLCYCVESLNPVTLLLVEVLLKDAGYSVKEGNGRASGKYLEISWEET